MRFLVVDDSTTMRRIMINALQRIGYHDAIEASNGQEALAHLDATVGCIITDWNMPEMSGLELAQSVRQTPAGRRVPILMVTTRGAREDILAAVEAGVNGYLVKPFTPSVLKEKIDRIFSGAGAAA
ncbi:MAG TPA: response regulator [Gemmatimonadaceae bacterium]|nr:response regulator [Gemmatimonadaceae bacterium]